MWEILEGEKETRNLKIGQNKKYNSDEMRMEERRVPKKILKQIVQEGTRKREKMKERWFYNISEKVQDALKCTMIKYLVIGYVFLLDLLQTSKWVLRVVSSFV